MQHEGRQCPKNECDLLVEGSNRVVEGDILLFILFMRIKVFCKKDNVS